VVIVAARLVAHALATQILTTGPDARIHRGPGHRGPQPRGARPERQRGARRSV
jgi:hypothetical protein